MLWILIIALIPEEEMRCVFDDKLEIILFISSLKPMLWVLSTHNIGFYDEMTKIIFQLSSNMHLICYSSR